MLPCGVNLFVDPIYGSEDIAMPKVVSEHVKRQQGHRNIYVLDRGLQSTRNMAAFSKESICFIARSKENRKYVKENLREKQKSSPEIFCERYTWSFFTIIQVLCKIAI